jgi:hypothetical protein
LWLWNRHAAEAFRRVGIALPVPLSDQRKRAKRPAQFFLLAQILTGKPGGYGDQPVRGRFVLDPGADGGKRVELPGSRA